MRQIHFARRQFRRRGEGRRIGDIAQFGGASSKGRGAEIGRRRETLHFRNGSGSEEPADALGGLLSGKAD